MDAIETLVDEVRERIRAIDTYFLVIQSDRKLMKAYLDLVSDRGLKAVNSQIAAKIANGRETKAENRSCIPVSTLIQSFSELGNELS